MRRLAVFLLSVAIGVVPCVARDWTSTIAGTWLTAQGTEVTLAPCERAFCGYITRIVVTSEMKSKYGLDAETAYPQQFRDVMNPDPTLRSRPIDGLHFFTVAATSDYELSGQLYNPEDGRTYDGHILVQSQDQLVIKGCALVVICQEQTWVRVIAR